MDSGRISRRDHDHRLVPCEHLRLQGEPGIGERAQGPWIGGREDVRPRAVLDLRAQLLRPAKLKEREVPGCCCSKIRSRSWNASAATRRRTRSAGRGQQCAAGSHGAKMSRRGDSVSSQLYGSSVTRCPDWRVSYPPRLPSSRRNARPLQRLHHPRGAGIGAPFLGEHQIESLLGEGHEIQSVSDRGRWRATTPGVRGPHRHCLRDLKMAAQQPVIAP